MASTAEFRNLATWRDAGVAAAVALTVFFLTYASGGFYPTTRAYAAIVVWWILGAGAAIGVGFARSEVGRLALVAWCLLAAFALWTLLSWSWAPDAERMFAQFNQVSLYVAVLALAIAVARLIPAAALTAGLALAVSAVAGVALVSRLFPSTFSVYTGGLSAVAARLSFPIGYWNGLGIGVALAYPLLLAFMGSHRSRWSAWVAALPLPILAADMYLASSRGAFVTAAVGVVAYILLSPNRWNALAAGVFAAISGGLAVAVLHSRLALRNGTGGALAAHQGHHAALWLGLIGVGGAFAWLGVLALGRRLPTPSSRTGWFVAGVIVVAFVALVIAAHPIRHIHEFTQVPNLGGSAGSQTNHLVSSSGSGRWQFWQTAWKEFTAHPLNGGGAGSYKYWWLRYGSLPVYNEQAHSLYLETLAELGIVGFLLLVGSILVAIVGSVRSALALRSRAVASAAACGIAFFAAASFDWVWQLSGVAVVGVAALGIALGALPSSRATRSWGRFGALRPVLAVLAVAAIIPQLIVLASGLHLNNSRAEARAATGQKPAVEAAHLASARTEALKARAVEPWAATPYLQVGLIDEQLGRLASARHWVSEAIDRSPLDWDLWYTAARIDTKRANVAAAKRDLAQVRRLNHLFRKQ